MATICEQLPPADRDPGARQADVVNYIDIQAHHAFQEASEGLSQRERRTVP
jgi:hypothetical protein